MLGFLIVIMFFAALVFVITVLDRLRKVENQNKRLLLFENSINELHRRITELEKQPSKKDAKKDIQKTEPAPVIKKSIEKETQPSISRPTIAPQVIQTKSRTREEWEAFIGGKLLNRIGSLALILGIGFFLKYAFDNNWLSELVRVCIGAFCGIACIFSAFFTHKKGFTIFAQGLVAAGISILYLSVYASFNFYHLIPQIPAFMLMSFLTTLTFGMAIRYNAFAVGLLGWLGGFLTPIMLSTGVPNEIGLFTYLALLNVGLLGIVIYKPSWQLLEILSFATTWIYYLSWFVEYYTKDGFAITTFFVILFWMLFYGVEIARIQLSLPANARTTQWLSIINAIVFSSTLYALVNGKYPEVMGIVLGLCGLIYLGTQLYAYRKKNVTEVSSQRLLLTSVVLFFVAIGVHFTSYRIPLGWTILSYTALWAGTRWNIRLLRLSGQAILIIVIMSLFSIPTITTYIPAENFSFLMNWRTFTLLSLIGSLSFAALTLRNQSTGEQRIATINIYIAVATGFFLLTVESNDLFRNILQYQSGLTASQTSYLRYVVLASIWNLFGAELLWTGVKKEQSQIIFSAFAVLCIALMMNFIQGIHIDPIESFTLLFNWRVFALLINVVIVLLCVNKLIHLRSDIPWKKISILFFKIGIVAILFVLLTGETYDYFAQKIETALQSELSSVVLTEIENQQQLSLSVIWLLYSVALMAGGILRSNRGVRIISIAIFGFTIAKIFLFDLSYLNTLYRIFSFIGLGLILLAVSYAYQRFKDVILKPSEEA